MSFLLPLFLSSFLFFFLTSCLSSALSLHCCLSSLFCLYWHHSLVLSHKHTHTHTLTNALSLSLSLTHTHTHTPSLHTHTHRVLREAKATVDLELDQLKRRVEYLSEANVLLTKEHSTHQTDKNKTISGKFNICIIPIYSMQRLSFLVYLRFLCTLTITSHFISLPLLYHQAIFSLTFCYVIL